MQDFFLDELVRIGEQAARREQSVFRALDKLAEVRCRKCGGPIEVGDKKCPQCKVPIPKLPDTSPSPDDETVENPDGTVERMKTAMAKRIPFTDRVLFGKGLAYLAGGGYTAVKVNQIGKQVGMTGHPRQMAMAKVGSALSRVRRGNPILLLRRGAKTKKLREALEAARR